VKRWTVQSSQLLLDRKWLRLRQEHVVLPSGVEIDEFHVIESTDWVATLALTDDGHVVLVDQYRHGVGCVSRELPAGVIDPRESPLDAARRELLEETGYEAPDWQPLLSVATEPSRHTNRAHFFVATGARRVATPRLDASEDIDVCLMTPPALLASIDAGAIVHGLHVAAVLTAVRRGYLPPA
jgi:8-oxo-dGTP pyrophosphatase MutT (NUDIX family)